MPMIRISTAFPYSDTEKKEISDLIQSCMEEHFDTPKNDRFHIFEQLKGSELIVDPNYWVEQARSDKFIMLYITSGKIRTLDQKSALMKSVTEQLGETYAIPEQDVMFVIVLNTFTEWCFGHAERADQRIQRMLAK